MAGFIFSKGVPYGGKPLWPWHPTPGTWQLLNLFKPSMAKNRRQPWDQLLTAHGSFYLYKWRLWRKTVKAMGPNLAAVHGKKL